MKFLGLFLVLLLTLPLGAKQTVIDSLQQLLSESKAANAVSVTHYIDICRALYKEEKHELVLVYGKEGIGVAEQAGLLFEKALLTELVALSLEFLDIDQSIEMYLKALAAYEKAGKSDWIDDKEREGVGNAHSILIQLYARKGEMDKAMLHFELIEDIVKDEQIYTKVGIYESMGYAQIIAKNYEQALEYWLKTVELIEAEAARTGIRIAGSEENYAEIARLYWETNQPEKALEYIDTAQVLSKNKQSARLRGRAAVMRNSGEIYLGLNRLEEATSAYQESLSLYTGLKDSIQMSKSAAALSECFLKQNAFEKAYDKAKQAVQLAKKFSDLIVLKAALESIQAVCLANKDQNCSLNNSLELLELNTQIYNQNSIALTEEFSKRFETKEQKTLLRLRAAQIARQRLLLWGIGIIAILFSVLSFFIYQAARQRQRTNQQLALQNTTIAAQNIELQTLDKAKSNFFTNISHELRTPLTLIISPLENVIKNTKDGAQKEGLELAHTNSKRLLSLVNEIMDLSKLESGKLDLNLSKLELNTFLERIFNSYNSLAKARGIRWYFDNRIKDATWVEADINKLEKMLTNLLSNAIKHTPRGGKVSFETRSLATGQFELSIQDTGTGIPLEEQTKIFDRFYQSKQRNAAVQGGTGIGLALVQEYTKLMGGKIELDSKSEEGSTFILHLPLSSTSPAASPAPKFLTAKPEQLSITQTPISKEDKARVLIVEDNLEMSNYMQRILSEYYYCTPAYDGVQALDLLQKEQFDLITSDVMMPNMDGFTFRERVNQIEQLRDIPFIMLTALSQEESRLKGLRLGVDDYISKPFSAAELQARMRNLLHNKYEREAWRKAPGNVVQEILAKTAANKQVTAQEEELIQRIEHYILEHLTTSTLSVESLSQAFYYSRRQMTRIIKGLTGLSGIQFIREVRLRRAYELLENRQVQTVAELAFEVGFEKPSYFSSRFQERFGRRPSDLLV